MFVSPHPPLAAVDAVVVFDGPWDGQVAFHSNRHGHVDGAGHHNIVGTVKDVSERVLESERKPRLWYVIFQC